MNKYHVIEFLIAPDSDGRITPNFSDPAFSVLVVCRCGTEPILIDNIPFIIILMTAEGTAVQEQTHVLLCNNRLGQ